MPDDLASVVKLVLAETGPVQAKANWIAFSVAGAQHMLVECTHVREAEEARLVVRRARLAAGRGLTTLAVEGQVRLGK